MTNTDFTAPTAREPLILRPGTDKWGPFAFDFSSGLPAGTTISSVTVEAYDSAGESASIIEPDSESVTGDAEVQLKFQAADGITAGKYYLRFHVTLSNSAVFPFRFGPVTVLGW